MQREAQKVHCKCPKYKSTSKRLWKIKLVAKKLREKEKWTTRQKSKRLPYLPQQPILLAAGASGNDDNAIVVLH